MIRKAEDPAIIAAQQVKGYLGFLDNVENSVVKGPPYSHRVPVFLVLNPDLNQP